MLQQCADNYGYQVCTVIVRMHPYTTVHIHEYICMYKQPAIL